MTAGRKNKKPSAPVRPTNTLVLDHGASTLKAGLVGLSADDGGSDPTPRVIPNLIARDRTRKIYVASELENCKDFGELTFRRPVEKGWVVNWEVQKEIWDREIFASGDRKHGRKGWDIDPNETRLLLTEPGNGLPVLQSNCDQMVFEEYGFTSYARVNSPSCMAYHDVQSLFRTTRDAPWVSNVPAEVMMVVDTGYSSTTVTPILQGRPLQSAVRRLDIGGRFLTNYLTRLISLRHFDMRNDSYIVNEMKEKACYVTSDFDVDLNKCWKGTKGSRNADYHSGGAIARGYILPDFHSRVTGELIEYDPARNTKAKQLTATGQLQEDILTLRNERFTVPEILFRPSDVGMRQPGLADLIQESLEQLPLGLWPGLLANIVVVGGNSLFDGFVQRLQKEVVQRVPDDCVVRVARPTDPVVSTWQGAAHLSRHSNIEKLVVTKKEYEEYGAAWVGRKFTAGLPLD